MDKSPLAEIGSKIHHDADPTPQTIDRQTEFQTTPHNQLLPTSVIFLSVPSPINTLLPPLPPDNFLPHSPSIELDNPMQPLSKLVTLTCLPPNV